MRPAPLRLGDPLEMPRRADQIIVGYCVVVRIVIVLLPLVDLVGGRFDSLLPYPPLGGREPARAALAKVWEGVFPWPPSRQLQ